MLYIHDPYFIHSSFCFQLPSIKVTQSCPTLCDPMDCSLSMGFSRQEYWSGLPLPPPGDLPGPGIEPRSPALQADTLPSEPPGEPSYHLILNSYWKPLNLWEDDQMLVTCSYFSLFCLSLADVKYKFSS